MARGTSTGRAEGLLALVVTSVLWGTTGTAATFAPQVGPLAIGAFALGIGGLLQAVIAVPALRAEAPRLRSWMGTVLLGGIAVAIYPLAFYSSMHAAGVAVGTVVSLASAPLASGVLERIVDKSRLSRWWMLAALIGIVGSAVLCVARMGDDDAPAPVLGILLGLIAGLSYATYSWASHRLMAGGVRRSAAMGAVFGVGGVLLIPVLVVTGSVLFTSAQNFGVGVYMALVPMFLGYVLFGFALARVSPSTATTVTLLEPAVATVLAVVVVGERLSAWGWVGIALLAVVLVVLVVAPTHRSDPIAVETEFRG